MIDGLARLNVDSLRVGLWVVLFNDSRSTSRIWGILLGARWNPEFILLDAVMFSLSFLVMLHIWPHCKHGDKALFGTTPAGSRTVMFGTSSELGPLPDADG